MLRTTMTGVMATEIEAKLRIDDADAVRARLRSAGAVRVGAVRQWAAYFDTPSGDLQARDAGIRVRTSRNEAGEGRAVLTYKGPARPGDGLKVRPEHETTVGSAEAAEAILDGLGLVRTVAFEKRRESWRLDEAQVEVDELPELGLYLEVEAPDASAVRDVLNRLGLADAATITTPYVALVAGHLAGSGRAELRFL
jgi:adenylate cyclase class 2